MLSECSVNINSIFSGSKVQSHRLTAEEQTCFLFTVCRFSLLHSSAVTKRVSLVTAPTCWVINTLTSSRDRRAVYNTPRWPHHDVTLGFLWSDRRSNLQRWTASRWKVGRGDGWTRGHAAATEQTEDMYVKYVYGTRRREMNFSPGSVDENRDLTASVG